MGPGSTRSLDLTASSFFSVSSNKQPTKFSKSRSSAISSVSVLDSNNLSSRSGIHALSEVRRIGDLALPQFSELVSRLISISSQRSQFAILLNSDGDGI